MIQILYDTINKTMVIIHWSSKQCPVVHILIRKNGNISVGGYAPPPSPSIGKRPIHFRFFLLKASLSLL